MKHKFLSLFIATVAMTILNSPTFASVTINGIAYELYETTATVVSGGNYTGTIVIPASVEYNSVTYSVTSIGQSAFYNCSSLTSVTIPNSVTSIGDNAFRDCSSLTFFTIPNSLTSIGRSAFWGCSGMTSITVPNSVTSIGDNAFRDCSGLTSVTIPNSVTSIGSAAFGYCSGLTSVTIPNSVTSIGDWAFSYCSSLTSVTIPNSVTSIGVRAFRDCSSLTAIYVPCGEMERFKQLLNNDSRVKYAPLPYTITIYATNGNVTYPQTICDDMLLNATPDYGYHFVKWSDGNTDNPRTIVLTQDTTFIAEFAKNTYTISTESANPEWGTTAGGKSALYLDDVEISATPNYGYHFVRWNDNNTSNPRIITLTQDTTFTATFAKNTYNITKNAEHGSISGNSSAEYLDEVTLTVSSDYGYHFSKWSDGNTDNPRTIVLTQDTTFTAEFAKNTYSVTTTSANTDRGTTSGDGSALYLEQLTISATPNYGYYFDHWGIEKYMESIEYKNAHNDYVVKFSVPASWKNPYAWVWETGKSGSWATLQKENDLYVYRTPDDNMNIIVVPNGASWDNGQTGDLSITESCCYTISGRTSSSNGTSIYTASKGYSCLSHEEQTKTWIDTIVHVDTTTSIVITSIMNPLPILVTSNQKAIAYFAKNTYAITKQCDSVQGSISGLSQAEYLDTVILSADAKYGYHFTQWSDGITDNPRAIIISRDTTIIAEFAKNTYSLVVSNNTPDWGMTEGATNALYLDELTFSATPNYGYHFVRWSDGNTDNPRTIILSRDTTFTAEFAKNSYHVTTNSANAELGTTAGDGSALYLDQVTITATPVYGYHFTQWTDGSTDNPRIIEIERDTTFTAEFAINTYSITTIANHPEWGMTAGDTSVIYMSEVEISATPNYGYHFCRWSDSENIPSDWITVSEAYSMTTALGQNQQSNSQYTIYGYIVDYYGQGRYPNSYYMADTPDGEGSFVIFRADKSASIGNYVSVTGYLYNYLGTTPETKSGGVLQVLPVSENPRTITADGDMQYEAIFAKNIYNITTEANSNCGTISSPSYAAYLDQITMVVTNNFGYHFAQWTDGNTDNPRVVEITCDTAFFAEFAPDTFRVDIYANNPEYGVTETYYSQDEIIVDGAVLYGDYIHFRAIANYGYHFLQWSDGKKTNPRGLTVRRDTTFIATFVPDTFTVNVSCLPECGSVTGTSEHEYKDSCVLVATANLGYHFIQWSDGCTDNPRNLYVERDSTLVAEFMIDRSGTCGDNMLLEWKYDSDNKILTISGNGNLTTNKWYGLEAVNEMTELIIEDGVGIIGDSAFANITTLETVSIGKDVRKIQDYAFGNCYSLTSIYNYRRTPATAFATTFEDVDKYACTLYVFAGSEDMFRSATGWRDFYSIQPIGAETATTDVLTITPAENTADVVWPAVENADTYELTISDRNGNIICTLVFNSNGQLTSIAFSAPGRAQTSGQSAGFSFTVTGLDKGTGYDLTLTAKDNDGNTISSSTQSFTTTGGVTTDFEDMDIIAPVIRKQIINDMLYILLPDGSKYSATGVKVE